MMGDCKCDVSLCTKLSLESLRGPVSDNVDVFVDLQSALHYTKLNSVNVGAEQDGCGALASCEACHWTSRIATCKMAFSGHKYNRESLKVISCVMLLVTCKLNAWTSIYLSTCILCLGFSVLQPLNGY